MNRTLAAVMVTLVTMGLFVGGSPAQAAPKGVMVSIRATVDCEDTDDMKAVCVTFDEGEWRLMLSFKPYRYVKLNRCAVISTKKLPCVVPHKMKSGKRWVARKI